MRHFSASVKKTLVENAHRCFKFQKRSQPFMHKERPNQMKTLARLVLLVALILAMPAPPARAWPFKSKVTRENYEKIHNGMTKAQVETILGKPTEMKSEMGLQDLGAFESWIYWSRGIMVMIDFSNGYVSDKSWTQG
jgi:SmpA / OmlA family